MAVVFGPSVDCITHRHDSVIDITKWAQEYFQKPLSVNTICRAICRCQLKLYHAKRKPYVNMVQKRRRVLWAKAHLKWTVSKRKSVLWSDESKFDILVGNHWHRVLWAKEEGDLPECYERSVQKPASLMLGVHKCIRYGQLTCFGRHYECWKVYSNICSPPDDVYFREGLVYFSRTMQNHILQLLQQHGFILEESGCWIGLPAVQIFHL